jgi:DNA-binding GntR family transcriptional regulator
MTKQRANPLTAYDQIRTAIVEGRYPPGQRLVEQRIAEEFELSRTPVRESLRRLEAEGLVTSEPNRGSRVRPISRADIADIFGLRARLESYAADLAAQRATPQEIAELDEGIAEYGEALASSVDGDLDVVRQVHNANRRIHDAIIVAAKHERLSRTLSQIVDVPLAFQAFRQFNRAETERSHVFHRSIRDAIVAGDGVRASNLMSEHVQQGRDSLLAHLAAEDELG